MCFHVRAAARVHSRCPLGLGKRRDPARPAASMASWRWRLLPRLVDGRLATGPRPSILLIVSLFTGRVLEEGGWRREEAQIQRKSTAWRNIKQYPRVYRSATSTECWLTDTNRHLPFCYFRRTEQTTHIESNSLVISLSNRRWDGVSQPSSQGGP